MPTWLKSRSWVAALLFMVLLVGLALASQSFGVCWDETIHMRFAGPLGRWFQQRMPLDAESLRITWEGIPQYSRHPPFIKTLSAGVSLLASSVLPFPLSFRIANLFLCSLGLSAVFFLLAAEFGILRSLLAVALIVLQPRFFGELLINTNDGVIAIGWLVLAVLTWHLSRPKARSGRISSGEMRIWAVFYIVYGMMCASKLTGVIALAPVAIFYGIKKDRRSLLLTGGAFVAGCLALILLSPGRWHTPLSGLWSYLSYLGYRASEIKVPIYYFSQIYAELPPWHYFPVMLWVTLPPFHFLACGFVPFAWRDLAVRRFVLVMLPFILFWIFLGLHPRVPKHDGVRQFAAFWPFFGLLAWVGLLGLVAFGTARVRRFRVQVRERWVWSTAVAVVLLPCLASLIHAHPFEFSFYNVWVGGLRGAESRGFETQYYLESANLDAIQWLNAHVKPGESVGMNPYWPDLLVMYRDAGLLPKDIVIAPERAAVATYYLMIRRRSLVSDASYFLLPAEWEQMHDGVSLARVVRVLK